MAWGDIGWAALLLVMFELSFVTWLFQRARRRPQPLIRVRPLAGGRFRDDSVTRLL